MRGEPNEKNSSTWAHLERLPNAAVNQYATHDVILPPGQGYQQCYQDQVRAWAARRGIPDYTVRLDLARLGLQQVSQRVFGGAS